MREIPKRLNSFSYSQLVQIANTIFPHIPIPIIEFANEPFYFNQNEFGGSNVIYRARIIKNPKNIPHENISDISHISNENLKKIQTFGRINKIEESMFYGSLDYAVACSEAITKGNVFKETNSVMLTVGVWKFEETLNLVQIPYSEKVFKELYDTVHYNSETIQIEDIQKWNKEEFEKFDSEIEFEIIQFFADEFAKFRTKTDNDYFLTNYYADRVFDRISGHKVEKKADGIIYPSVASSYQKKNIALKPEVVENKMKFVDAMQIWIVNKGEQGGGTQFIPIKQRTEFDENGKLLWK